MHEQQENIKKRLQESAEKYKHRAYLKRKEVKFQVGDLAMAYVKNERFPKGTYNKLNLKNIGPFQVLRKFFANAYEIELPFDFQISPIFNVSDLYPFRDAGIQTDGTTLDGDDSSIDWQEQIPHKEQPHIEAILDKKILKKTRNKTFFQYLIKWKNKPTEDVAWMGEQEISEYNVYLEDLMKNYFLPREYDAGASSSA